MKIMSSMSRARKIFVLAVYKKQVAVEFKIPLFVRKVVNTGKNKIITVASSTVEGHEEIGVSPLQLRTAAMALLRHGSKMPSERREELTQIVKSYFGGRDISANDIETALLVGMSPHERRKLEKKRGVHFTSHEVKTMCSINTFSVEETFECPCDKLNISNTLCSSGCISSEDFKNEDGEDALSNPDFDSSSASTKPANYISSDIADELISGSLIEQQDICIVETDNGVHSYEEKGPSDDSSVSCLSSVGVSARFAKKLSLLGHGPHGRQVVGHLLKEQGEEGILRFCQRWRQVFVEAIHPRFLPAGWDIMHSGRREFGKYSVYNPSKENVQANA